MQFEKFRKFENAHIFLWLIKDMCWVTVSRTVGVAMILPIVFLSLYITWVYRKSVSELVHNTAVCSWIFANSIWMIGEFYFDDGLRTYAAAFFALGLLVIGSYYSFVFVRFLRNN